MGWFAHECEGDAALLVVRAARQCGKAWRARLGHGAAGNVTRLHRSTGITARYSWSRASPARLIRARALRQCACASSSAQAGSAAAIGFASDGAC